MSEVDEFYLKNIEALAQYAPALVDFLKKQPSAQSSIVYDEHGIAENISLGSTKLYTRHAKKESDDQFADYVRNPDRLTFGSLAECNLSPISRVVLSQLKDDFSPETLDLALSPVVDTGFAFLFGLGLGYGLEHFVKERLAQVIMVYEPVVEFMHHSLKTIDWVNLLRQVDEYGMRLEFCFNADPVDAVNSMLRLVVAVGQTFIDGTYAFVHYPSWQLLAARKLLNEKIKSYLISAGFFEDELLMMRNCYENFQCWDWSLIERKPHIAQSMPVFIAGSGPSLDGALETIRRHQNDAVIFSCGTSLGILLKNGIRPDFHVENENTAPLVDNIKDFSERYGLEGITLIASNTVNRAIASYFDKAWFYIRSELSSDFLLGNGRNPMPGAGPMVANAAAAAMTVLGFSNFYLMGVDCGRRQEASHHSKDVVYLEDGYDRYIEGESLERLENEFNREVPANFGGTALTTWYLDLSRTSFAALIKTRKITVYNCSDGAKIDGAIPKAISSVSVTQVNPGAKARVLGVVERQLEKFAKGQFLKDKDFADYGEQVEAAITDLEELCNDLGKGDPSWWDLDKALRRHCQEKLEVQRAFYRMTQGTYFSMIRMGAFLGTRIQDEKLRKVYFQRFIEVYLAANRAMAKTILALYRDMQSGNDVLQDFETDYDLMLPPYAYTLAG